jgi:hypothetical protein
MVNLQEPTTAPPPLGRSSDSLAVERQVRSSINELLLKFDALFDIGFEDFLAICVGFSFGGGAAAPLIITWYTTFREEFQEARKKLKEKCEQIERYLTHVGDGRQLNNTASMWSEKISGPVSAQAEWFSENSMHVIDKWTGDARQAYETLLPSQNAAIKHVSSLANQLNPVLTSCASAINKFWADICLTLSETLGGLARAVNGAATPDIFGKPGEIVEILATGIAKANVNFVTLMTECSNAISALEQILYSNDAFPDGHWPQPKATIGEVDSWEIDEDE